MMDYNFFLLSFLLDFICHEIIISGYPYFTTNSPSTHAVYSKSGMLKSFDTPHQDLQFFFPTKPHHNF